MTVNFQAEPFFDDYSEDKQFYRILFRPGYAVQARELTQMQTILQEQVRRHGDHIFKEGSLVIPGQISYDLEVYYVKLLTLANEDTTAKLNNLVGRIIKNDIGVSAKVLTYLRATEDDPYDTIFVKFISSSQIQDTLNQSIIQKNIFESQDQLNPDDVTGLTVTVSEKTAENQFPVGFASTASIERGIYYIKKHFVLVKAQTIVLDKYDNKPTYRVGLKLNEDAVYPEDDESLLDNSTGSPNYAAPGAARYTMDLELIKLNPQEQFGQDFIDLLRLENGRVIHKIDRSQYAELEKTLARRTYDESGDYSLAPFNIQVREYRNNFRGFWSADKSFIQGDIIRVVSAENALEYDYFVASNNGKSGSGLGPATPEGQPAGSWERYPQDGYVADGTGLTEIKWEYTTEPKFNRGVYSFSPSEDVFEIDDHIRLDGMLAIGIERNKAYVKGYEIEKLSTEYFPVEKSRNLPEGSAELVSYLGVGALPESDSSVSLLKTTTFPLLQGSYVIVENVLFSPEINNFSKVLLHRNVSASAGAGSVIGTARVRAFERHSVQNQYKVFLFDIEMSNNKDFSECKSIAPITGNSFKCDFVLEGGFAVIKDPGINSLIYPIDYAVKEITRASYTVVAKLIPSASQVTIEGVVQQQLSVNVSAPYQLTSTQDLDNYILINETTGEVVDPNDYTANITGTTLTILGKPTKEITNTSFSLLATLLIANNTNDFSYETVIQDDSDSFTTSSEVQRKIIYLDQSYVTRIISIKMNPAGFIGTTNNYAEFTEDITDRYIFNDGQTYNSAGRAFIELISESQYPRGAIVVNYEYLKMTDESLSNYRGAFVSVNSFTYSSNSGVRYDQIPNFNNLQLRDCIDFRPLYSITGSGTFRTKYMPKYGSEITLEYTHYLPRVDSVALSSTGRYVITPGIPDLIPIEPGIPDNSMKIAKILLEPYTFTTSQSSVIIEKADNKRYTMRDIGKLERRIQDLEYYTSLSLLELDTKNTRVIDSSGLERYQNGFIVDNFIDQSVGNTASLEWNASIDYQQAELRPFFSQDQLQLVRTTQQSGNFVVNGDLVSLPYTEAVMIEQTSASLTENVNPFAVYSWRGTVELNPWSDTWFETERRPDIVINDDGQYNAVVAKAEADGVLGTVWNSWQTVSTGAATTSNRTLRSYVSSERNELISLVGTGGGIRTITLETTAQDVNQTRTGVRNTVASRVDNQVIEDKILETRLIPFIRPRNILFNGYRFKPNTRLYAFFDGTNVDSYVTSAVRLKVARIQNDIGGYYPHLFNVNTNVGDLLESTERLSDDSNINDAFSHGELVREVNGFDHTAVVVGQEISGSEYFIYVMGVKNAAGANVNVTPANPRFSISSNSYLEGEFLNGSLGYSRVRILEVSPVSTIDSSSLYSSPVGNVFGMFSIPNDASISFRTGVRGFKLTDDISNNDDVASSHGSGFYEATGYLEVKQATVLSTRTAEIVSENVSENQTIRTTSERITADTGWYDPLAQTFLIQREGGAFLTSVDLYFSTVDNDVPVIVEIREVVNGYPGRKVIPFSRVIKNGSEITTSSNGSVATNFKFSSPVYLQNAVEYALVILSDSNQYRVFISQTDTIDLITQNRISSQPYNGVLFKSQNGSTWTADQTQDLKFKIYNAVFQTSPQTIDFTTSASNLRRLSSNPLYFKRGTNKIRVFHKNHGMSVGDSAQIMIGVGRSITNTYGIPQNEILGQHTIIKASADDYVIQVQSFANSTGFGGGNFVNSRIFRKFQISNINISQIEIPDTKITYSIRTTNDTPGSSISDISEPIIIGENYYHEVGKVRRNPNSIIVTANLSTTNPNVSPIIDLGRAAITLISNKINNPSYLDNDLDLDFEPINGLQSDISSISISSGVATITTAYDHGFYTGQKVKLQLIGTTSYSYLNDTFDITEIVDSNQFKFDIPTASDLQELSLNGIVTPRSTEIGVSKPFIYDESENSIKVLSTSVEEFIQLDKLRVGNILRFKYSSETADSFKYMKIISKIKSIDESEVKVLLEPEVSGSAIRDTASGETVDIVFLSKYVSEIATNIGTSISKYVTKKINLARQSEMLRIMLSANLPNGSSIKVYYKTGNNNSAENFFNSKYIEAEPLSPYITSTSFIDYTIDVEGILPFDTFIIKIVMETTNPSNVPRIKDLRVIACAA